MSTTSTAIRPTGSRAPETDPRRSFGVALLRFTLVPLIAFGIVLAAVNGGGSPPAARSVAALLVWWAVLMGVAFSLVPRARIPRSAVAFSVLLLAFALLTALSTGWAPSAERAFAEFDRVLLYLGVAALPILFARSGDAGRWADGMALATAVVALLAVGQRLFPGVLPDDHLADVLPDAATRLSFPLGYWNGLAIFVALGIPLLLRTAVLARSLLWRAAALAPIPLLTATLYLSSSRGGVAVAVVGSIVFVTLSGRLRALLALIAAGVGSGLVVAVLAARPELVDGPFRTASAKSAGGEAALLVLAICVVAALIYAALSSLLAVRHAVPLVAWVVFAVVAVGGIVVADPAQRLSEFKAVPAEQPGAGSVGVGSHLASGSGSGRWQFWGAALRQFSDHPVTGGGAGSYESWWAQHGTINWFVRNAHSLWAETLGELGLLGLLLLAGAFCVGIGAGVARLRGREPDDRTTVAALVAVAVAFAVGAAIDWVWQLPAVAALALLALGLLTGPATARGAGAGAGAEAAGAAPEPDARRSAAAFSVRAVLVLGAWIVICAQAIPFVASQQVASSQSAAAGGDLAAAIERARAAEGIQPWAASPHLQLALVREEAGDIDAARRDIARAIDRDSGDWRLHVIAARLAVKARDVPAARRELGLARRLNPRSQLLRNSRG